MTRLLHISASPRGPASESLALADAFLQAHQAARPDVQVDHLDLFDGTLPEFGRLAAGAKMAVLGGGQPSPDRWSRAKRQCSREPRGTSRPEGFSSCP
jgi:FMN-dependent NADH-azoreductase